mgnify:CR=1 FL=1
MLRLNLAQYRIAFITNAGNRAVAALHETAGIRQVDRSGNFALDNLTLRLILAHDRQRNCRKQCLSIRMQRIFEQQISGCFFYMCHIHNRNIIREIFYNGQVMGDEDIGKYQILLQLLEQVQNLRLNGTSSAETGSSQTMILGFIAKARAMPIRLTAAAVQLMRIYIA